MFAGYQLSRVLESEQKQQPIIEGTVLTPARALQAFELMDQRRHEFTLQSFKDKWSLVFIGYTNCPDVCPNALMVMKQAVEDMEILKIPVPQVVFVSVDPERDEPEILGDYVYYFNPNFIGVTGKDEQLKNLSRQLSAVYMKAAGASGDINQSDYLFDHSASILVINPQAQLQAVFSAPQNKLGIVDGMQQIYRFAEDSTK